MKKITSKLLLILFLFSGLLSIPAIAGRYSAHNDYMLATVLWHEIRGGTDMEIKQVANVIMNRLDMFERGNKEGYQLELGDILTAKAQFSGSEHYLNARMTDADILKHINLRGTEGQAWKRCLNIAQQALAGQLPDLTHGATHYRTCTGPNMTFWGASKIQGVSHGKHCFFKGINMGSMKVNGHTFRQGKVTGKYSNGGASVDNGGDGSGEGAGGSESYSSGGGSGGNYGNSSGGYDNGSFDFTFNNDEYIALCESAKTETDGSTTPPNLFDTQILTRMTEMMEKIYISLGQLYAMGQSLMCFATDVAPLSFKVFKFVNIAYWLTGLAIYLAAFFITVSVGLFFFDISFKIGFALLMLPISIALWPFEPTRGKLSENFSIIIRNSMLFALTSIGIAYAIILIQNGILHGIDEATFNKALADESAKQMAKEFAMSGVHVLIIIFCLIYGFKIIQSSIKDYLERLFPDNVFGGQSPMHQHGVQLIGTTAMYTVLPAASLVKDIALNQTGRGIQALGRGIQNIGRSSTPPNPTPVSGDSDSSSSPGGGSGVGGSSGSGGSTYSSGFQNDVQDDFKPTNSPTPEDEFQAPDLENNEKRANRGSGSSQGPKKAKTGDNKPYNTKQNPQKNLDQKRQENRRPTTQTTRFQNPEDTNRQAKQIPENSDTRNPVDTNKQTSSAFEPQPQASQTPDTQSPPQNPTDIEQSANRPNNNQQNSGFFGAVAAGIALGKQDSVKNYSLAPGNLLKNTANTTLNILTAPLNAKTYRQMMRLPEIMKQRAQMSAQLQQQRTNAENTAMPNATNNQKIIMSLSRTATLFVRTAKQTTKNTVLDTTHSAGSLLEEFGEKIRPTAHSAKGFDYWHKWKQEREKDRIRRLDEEKAQRETDATMANDFVDRNNG